MAYAQDSVIVLGGDAVLVNFTNDTTQDLSAYVPLAPPRKGSVSLELLLQEPTASMNDYDIISARLTSPDRVQHVKFRPFLHPSLEVSLFMSMLVILISLGLRPGWRNTLLILRATMRHTPSKTRRIGM
jgi:hypothetical protein